MPPGTGNILLAKQGLPQWNKTKHVNHVKPAPWQQSKSVGRKVTVDLKAGSIYPEQHEMEDIYNMSFTEAHQLARVMHLNITGEQWVNAKRCDLNSAKWAESSLRKHQLPNQPRGLQQCESCIHAAKCCRARIMAAGMEDTHREWLSYYTESQHVPLVPCCRIDGKHTLKAWKIFTGWSGAWPFLSQCVHALGLKLCLL